MAKIAKSKDTANYRKGKDLKVGDVIEVWVNGESVFSAITEYAGKVPYMGTSNYKFITECGEAKLIGGGEFTRGQF